MIFQTVMGDITTLKTDAIVLPANRMLKEGSGASEAIFKKAGRKELTAACKRLAPVDVGSAIPTSGYNLPAQFILHAVVPKWEGGKKDEYEYLGSAYLSCLSLADTMGCKSIAFPLLAAGNNGFDPKLAYRVAQEIISNYEPRNHLQTVFLVIYSRTVKALILSMGTPVQDQIDPVYLQTTPKYAKPDRDSETAKQQATDAALKSVKHFWSENKDWIVPTGIKLVKTIMNKFH